MSIHISSLNILRYSALACVFFLSFIPHIVSASHTKPSCTITASTSVGRIELDKKDAVFLNANDILYIQWKSQNAQKAYDSQEKEIALNGVATSSPVKKTLYEYTFVSGNKKVICEVTVLPVTATIATTSLVTEEEKPVIAGKAVGTKTVQFKVYAAGSAKVLFTSKVIRVKNGKWRSMVTKKLQDGMYDVIVQGEKKVALHTIATGTLSIDEGVQTSNTSATTLVVRSVPLLLGGTAHTGGTLAVSYLQVINVGKQAATVKGFTLKQNGSAGTDVVIGLSAADDTSLFKGSVGGMQGSTPFKDGLAYVPVSPVVLSAGQMRLFTLKAQISQNIVLHIGKQLKLDVVKVDSNASINALFPIRGTTWTIGY